MKRFTLDYVCWHLIPAAVFIGVGLFLSQLSHPLPVALSLSFFYVAVRVIIDDPELHGDAAFLEIFALLFWFLGAVLFVLSVEAPAGSTSQIVLFGFSVASGGLAGILHLRHFRRRRASRR